MLSHPGKTPWVGQGDVARGDRVVFGRPDTTDWMNDVDGGDRSDRRLCDPRSSPWVTSDTIHPWRRAYAVNDRTVSTTRFQVAGEALG